MITAILTWKVNNMRRNSFWSYISWYCDFFSFCRNLAQNNLIKKIYYAQFIIIFIISFCKKLIWVGSQDSSPCITWWPFFLHNFILVLKQRPSIYLTVLLIKKQFWVTFKRNINEKINLVKTMKIISTHNMLSLLILHCFD